MADILLPPYLPVARLDLGVQDGTAADVSPVTGLVQTSEVFGVRKRTASLQFENIDRRSGNLAVLRSFLSSMQGRKNRVWIGDASYQQRGSFSAPELLTNNDFSNGTTGWTFGSVAGAPVTSVSDRRLRIQAHSSVGNYFAIQTPGATANVPYALRVFFETGNSRNSATKKARLDDGTLVRQSSGTDSGYQETWYVPPSAAVNSVAWMESTLTAGEYFDVAWTALSRCALADSGANSLLHSASLANASWTASTLAVTRTDNTTTAPDGTTTAGTLDATSATHNFSYAYTVTSGQADYFFGVALKANSRSWAQIGISDFLISGIEVWINLSSGTLSGTVTGASWSNVRSASVSLGDGWWLACIAGRKTGVSTSVGNVVRVGSAVSTAATGTIYCWRPTMAAGSVFGRLVSTGATAVTSGNAQTGATIFLKGLPASTNGLLLTGDRVQIGSRLREVIAPLNSNAAGQGVLVIDEPIPGGVADNAPVIVNNPMGRFMLAGEIGLSLTPGVFGNSSLPLVEA